MAFIALAVAAKCVPAAAVQGLFIYTSIHISTYASKYVYIDAPALCVCLTQVTATACARARSHARTHMCAQYAGHRWGARRTRVPWPIKRRRVRPPTPCCCRIWTRSIARTRERVRTQARARAPSCACRWCWTSSCWARASSRVSM